MGRITVAQVRASRIPTVLSVCPTGPELLSYCNEGEVRLMSLPNDWWGTWQQARFTIIEGCLTWPRGVVDIRQASACNQPFVLRNEWYHYVMPVGQPGEARVTGNFLEMESNGTSPVAINILVTGSTIRVYPGDATDVGKKILIQGYDKNGVWVRTVDAVTGVWTDGEYVTLAEPFVDTTTQWLRQGITGVQRDATNQPTTIFELNATTLAETEMASYQPDDDVPSFRRSKIINYRTTAPFLNGCDCTFQLNCIAKLGHVPVRQDTDYFVIQNMAALKDAAMSVKLDEDQGVGAGDALFNRAKKILNDELKNFNGRLTHIRADLHGGFQFGRSVVAGMR